MHQALKRVYDLSGASQNPRMRALFGYASAPLVSVLARRQGFSFGPYCDWFTRFMFVSQWYERQTVEVCRRVIQPGQVVVDVGAHLGYYSRLFSDLVGPNGTVFAFEPHPETYELLSRNALRGRHRNVVPVQKAVADGTEVVDLHEMTASGQHSLYNVPRAATHAYFSKTIPVQSTSLDAFLHERGDPRVGLIKMDIEGAEPRALAGMRGTIARSRTLALVVEFNPFALRGCGFDPDDLLANLSRTGFRVEPIGTAREELARAHPDEWSVNLLCMKQ